MIIKWIKSMVKLPRTVAYFIVRLIANYKTYLVKPKRNFGKSERGLGVVKDPVDDRDHLFLSEIKPPSEEPSLASAI